MTQALGKDVQYISQIEHIVYYWPRKGILIFN